MHVQLIQQRGLLLQKSRIQNTFLCRRIVFFHLQFFGGSDPNMSLWFLLPVLLWLIFESDASVGQPEGLATGRISSGNF